MISKPEQRREDDNKEMSIDLAGLIRVVWKKIHWVAAAGVICAVLAMCISLLFIKPTYRTSFTAFINNRSSSSTDTQAVSNGDTAAGQSLTYTYAAIIRSRAILQEAAEKAGISEKYTYDQISAMVDTSIVSNTQLINVYVTTRSKDETFALANAIAAVAPSYVENIVEGSSMKIASQAVYPEKKYSPSHSKNTVLGFLLGFFAAIVVIVAIELFDTRVKDEEELSARFGIPVVGTIPNMIQARNSSGAYAYQYRAVNKKKNTKEEE